MKIETALLSVSDKSNLETLAKALVEKKVKIYSSGGTKRYLEERGFVVFAAEELTGNPEAFGGRMKTISFQVSSGILYRRDHEEDQQAAKDLQIPRIDLVVCHLYPFEEVLKNNEDWSELVENIDIGGPTMIRAAAKNYAHVAVLSHPAQYHEFLDEFQGNGMTAIESRKKWARDVFRTMSQYDGMIARSFENDLGDSFQSISGCLSQGKKLRYGENPHQKATLVPHPEGKGLANALPIQGKELSYNNLLDADAAWRTLKDLHLFSLSKKLKEKSAVVVIKHLNPCGAALSSNLSSALNAAWNGDSTSSFGSIIAFNEEVTIEEVDFFKDKFVEILIAPAFTEEALKALEKKKNLRVLKLDLDRPIDSLMVRSVDGGLLMQNEDDIGEESIETVTKIKFSENLEALSQFSVRVGKHLKSNAIVLVGKNSEGYQIFGAGMGNPNRLVSVEQAVAKVKEKGKVHMGELVLYSDAFFPFDDNIKLAHQHGIRWVVQPGGSIRDQEVISTCDQLEIAMAFTGKRHFRH